MLILLSQEAGQVVWYSHVLKNFPQFIVIHIVKGFGIVNKAKVDVFLELSCFFDDPSNVGNLISGSSAFSKTSLNIWKFTVHPNAGIEPWSRTLQADSLLSEPPGTITVMYSQIPSEYKWVSLNKHWARASEGRQTETTITDN